MSPTLEELGIDRMSAHERIALAQKILETVSIELEPSSLTPAKREELRRRVAELEANPGDVVPWEEVRAAAQMRCAK